MAATRRRTDLTPHWLKGEAIQNYGDFLSELLIERLFEAPPSGFLRVIGSCLADEFVPPGLAEGEKIVFWGCGARDETPLGEAARARMELPSVRGPLTRSILRLGEATPIGDTALLLPLLHSPAEMLPARPKAILVPHFHDRRTDQKLCIASGCEAVLRPNIRNSQNALADFINAITRARFVLAASLHAAITAAAYGVPFAFWNSGAVDLPFKWQDFAASLHIPCVFHDTLKDGEAWYASEAAPDLSLPPLWPMLASAPLPVRPELLVDAMRRDVRRHGPNVLDTVATARSRFTALGDLSRRLSEERQTRTKIAETLQAAFPSESDPAGTIDPDTMDPSAVIERLKSAGLELRTLRSSLAETENTVTGLLEELGGLRQLAATQISLPDRFSDFELRKLEQFFARQERHTLALDQQAREQALTIQQMQAEKTVMASDELSPLLQALRQRLQTVEAERDTMARSSAWRIRSRIVGILFRHARIALGLRRLLKLGWWVVSLRLASRLRQRRRLRRNFDLLGASPLFDADWYSTRYTARISAGIDPLTHFIWIGALQGLNPHPLFDTNWYMSKLPAGSTENPLAHYLSNPACHDPHPLFDSPQYLRRIGGLLPTGMTPLEHFVTRRRGAESPNEILDPDVYVFEYPQAAGYLGGAFAHYVEHGEAAGLAPHPLFDPSWYAGRHPESIGPGPLAHYLRHGRDAGFAGSAIMETCPLLSDALTMRLAFPETSAPDISIIIPAYGHLHQTYRCLAAIMVHSGTLSYEVLVVDDRPDAPIAPLLKGENLRLHVNAENMGFLRSCNAAARLARGRKLVFLNNDTIVGPDWLRPMVSLMEADQLTGLVGCKLLNTDGTVQEAGGIIHSNGWGFPYGNGDDPGHGAYNYVREVDVVTGACFLVRRDLFELCARLL